ncbi:hypothetical protein [Rhodovulum sp. MB263]|uniref:hypothetical protein n=1 Tax=Rhodovulum sp. (strain MB263) TaxID=308754 RepID=UPI0012DB4984|nr:hypothetical protein [Rhodovulum sp. MB263]
MRERMPIARANSVQFVPHPSRDSAKENAAADGPRNGAENACEGFRLPCHSSLKAGVSATLKYASDAHDRASRMLAAALTLEDFDAWAAASAVWAARLTARERASLAYAALRSLEPEQAEMTAATVLRAAGAPMPPFLRGMEEARFWASLANRAELKAFALASFEAMAPRDQTAFLRHISEIEVAA